MRDQSSHSKSSRSTELAASRLTKIIDLQSRLVALQFHLPDFMQAVVAEVQTVTRAGGAVVELTDEGDLIYAAASGTVAGHVGLRLRQRKSLSGLCIQSGEILVSPDTAVDARVDRDACRKVGAAAMAVVPLRRLGEIMGVLKVVWPEPRAIESHDVEVLQMMAGLLGAALGQQLEIDRRRQLEEELRSLAGHDALTGLPNRRLFTDRLEQALARHARAGDSELALMYFDIDHFKNINDELGHAAGDALLQAFVTRIQSVVRSADTLARLGGDEFVLLLESPPGAKAAEAIADKILALLREPFELDGHSVIVSSSIGVVALASTESAHAHELIRRADGAMYAAKRAGRNAVRSAREPLATR